MPRRSTSVSSALIAVLCLSAAVTAAAAADPAPLLRVQGTGATLDPGTRYVTGTESLPKATDAGCKKGEGAHRVTGATALGLLGSAFEDNRKLRPLGVADDEFGLRVCRVGPYVERDNPFTGWLYRVNHKSPSVGAALKKVGAGDEVLWFFANFGTGVNTGDELVLGAPVRAKPGTIDVRVTAFAFDGTAKPAPDGTVVSGGEKPATVMDGVAKVQVKEGALRLRAVHKPDIPSAPVEVCVSAGLSECPGSRGATIIGRSGADRIRGTSGPDLVRVRGGADKVNVRGGGADRVNCGAGRDRVVLSGADQAAGCEVRITR